MQTINIVLCSMNLAFCLFSAVSQEDKRGAYIIGSLGWFVALINVAF